MASGLSAANKSEYKTSSKKSPNMDSALTNGNIGSNGSCSAKVGGVVVGVGVGVGVGGGGGTSPYGCGGDDSSSDDLYGAGDRSPTPNDSALPSDCDHNFDHHSSEEELEVINNSCNARENNNNNGGGGGGCHGGAQFPEKRKWSQMNRRSFGDSSGGSSDEEVRDLMSLSPPVQFRSSPPADAHKPSHSQSPPAKLFHFSSASSYLAPFEVCSVSSPRKRHRQSNHHGNGAQIQRPCLDFEKMQQLRTRAVSAWRPSRELSLIC